MTAESESARPLDAILSEFDEFCPGIAESSLFQEFTFTGTTTTQERFYADEILSQ